MKTTYAFRTRQLSTRYPGVEPVSAWPGLPVVPGAIRRPVPGSALRMHRDQTEGHVRRLEQAHDANRAALPVDHQIQRVALRNLGAAGSLSRDDPGAGQRSAHSS